MYEMERLEARLSKGKTEGRTESEKDTTARTLKRMKQIKEQKT